MEPLLSIIGMVAGAFGNEALNETARRTVVDLWEAAKKVIVAKFGSSNQVPQIMDEMRRQPTQSAAEHVAAQLTALNVTSDPEVARVFRELAEIVKAASGPAQPLVKTVNGVETNHGNVSMHFSQFSR